MSAAELPTELRSDTIIEDVGCSISELSSLSEKGVGQLVMHACLTCKFQGYNDADDITVTHGDRRCNALSRMYGLARAHIGDSNEVSPV